MNRIQELREQRTKLVADARALITAAEQAGRDLTADEDAQFAKIMDEADRLGQEIADLERRQQQAAARSERLQRVEEELRALHRGPLAGSAAGPLPGSGRGGPAGPTDADFALALQGWFLAQTLVADVTDEHREAARRCGLSIDGRVLNLRLHSDYRHIQAALRSNVPERGGVLRLGEFIASLELAMLESGPMLDVAQVIRTTHANPLPWPHANDTSNTGRQIGEAKPVSSDVDPTFGALILSAYKFTSDEILVPYELLRDSGINLPDVLGAMLGERLGRVQNTKYTVGTGAGTAHGIVPRSSLGVTAAGATAISPEELIDLQHAVPRAYRSGAAFMAADSTIKALRKLKDQEGRFIWQPGLTDGAPDTLLNWPIYANDDMPEIAAGNITVVAGRLNQYKVRQVNQVRLYRLTERHREEDQDAFLAFIEADGDLLDPGVGPVRHLRQAS